MVQMLSGAACSALQSLKLECMEARPAAPCGQQLPQMLTGMAALTQLSLRCSVSSCWGLATALRDLHAIQQLELELYVADATDGYEGSVDLLEGVLGALTELTQLSLRGCWLVEALHGMHAFTCRLPQLRRFTIDMCCACSCAQGGGWCYARSISECDGSLVHLMGHMHSLEWLSFSLPQHMSYRSMLRVLCALTDGSIQVGTFPAACGELVVTVSDIANDMMGDPKPLWEQIQHLVCLRSLRILGGLRGRGGTCLAMPPASMHDVLTASLSHLTCLQIGQEGSNICKRQMTPFLTNVLPFLTNLQCLALCATTPSQVDVDPVPVQQEQVALAGALHYFNTLRSLHLGGTLCCDAVCSGMASLALLTALSWDMQSAQQRNVYFSCIALSSLSTLHSLRVSRIRATPSLLQIAGAISTLTTLRSLHLACGGIHYS